MPESCGENPHPNISDSLDKEAVAQVWLFFTGIGQCGRVESWELVGSSSMIGVAGAASGLLSSWRPRAAVLREMRMQVVRGKYIVIIGPMNGAHHGKSH